MVLVLSIALGVTVTACGGSSSTESTGGESAESSEGGGASESKEAAEGSEETPGTPVKGGVLTFARSEDTSPGLNPIGLPTNGSIFVMQQIFDQLVETEGDKEVHPGLARSWESSKDGLHWTFHLREAEFSNGEPVTAEDVKWSIECFANPKIDVSYAFLAESIKDVKIDDPKTVTIDLKKVDAPFLYNLAVYAAAIRPKKVVEEIGEKEFAQHPVGSGPFMLKQMVVGQQTSLVPNPHYWRKNEPYLEEVVFQYVPDANTRVLKVTSGEAQVANEIPYNQVEQLNEAEGLEVQVQDTYSWSSVFLNQTKPPLEDEKIRQALNYATPKEAILESVFHGFGEVSNSNTPKLKFWDSSVQPYPYDLEKAEELMAESSQPNGFKLELWVPGGEPAVVQTAEILKQEWAKIGVNVDIVPKETSALISAWIEGKGGMAATWSPLGNSSDTITDDEIVGLILNPDAGLHSNGTYYDNPKVTKMMTEARETLDENERAQIFSEIQQIALNEAPSVPLFFTKSLTAVHDEVKDFSTFPIGWWPLREVWMEG
ncbi:MAG: ABC transporter substrate-binding protein [Actinobacteria bacterium]|nr:ABC transporter substrate-binding protein [Actinomycetota bacterium]